MKRRPLTAVALAIVAIAAPTLGATSAATHPKVLGGGYVGTVFGPYHYPQYIRLDRVSGARTATLRAVAFVTCPGLGSKGRSVPVRTDPNPVAVTLDSTDSFAGSVPVDLTLSGGSVNGARAVGTLTYSGHFARGGHSANGVAREQLSVTRTNGQTRNCDTRTFPWKANNPFAERITGKARGATAYYGRSTADGPMLLRLSPNGRYIANLATEVPLSCASNARDEDFAYVQLHKGAFSFRLTDKSVRPGGQTDHFRYTVKGKVGRRAVAGRIRVKAFATRGGKVFRRCDTGTVAWRASR